MSSTRAGEFALIDAFLAPFGLSRESRAMAPGAAGVILGPGDDCARLLPSRGKQLIATTDAAVDGVHFDLARSSAEDAGWKALAMNLSDLAAAGAVPRWFLCALSVPKLARAQAIATAQGFARGMAQLAKASGCTLVGGNVTRARDWSITITALGETAHPLSRAGGKPGDRLLLVGELGAAALGLILLRKRRKPALGKDERAAVQAQLRPVPQARAGQIAARLASAAIDLSDGLLQDLGHLCARSGCTAELQLASLPRSPAVRAHEAKAATRGAHPYALSLSGGEEYALLLAVPRKHVATLRARLAREQIDSNVIGSLATPKRFSRTPNAITLWDQDRAIPLPERLGHDHLAR